MTISYWSFTPLSYYIDRSIKRYERQAWHDTDSRTRVRRAHAPPSLIVARMPRPRLCPVYRRRG